MALACCVPLLPIQMEHVEVLREEKSGFHLPCLAPNTSFCGRQKGLRGELGNRWGGGLVALGWTCSRRCP